MWTKEVEHINFEHLCEPLNHFQRRIAFPALNLPDVSRRQPNGVRQGFLGQAPLLPPPPHIDPERPRQSHVRRRNGFVTSGQSL